MKALVQPGEDARVQDIDGDTSLNVASIKGHAETVKALVQQGANVRAQNNNGYTTLHWAARWRHTETVEALEESEARTHHRYWYRMVHYIFDIELLNILTNINLTVWISMWLVAFITCDIMTICQMAIDGRCRCCLSLIDKYIIIIVFDMNLRNPIRNSSMVQLT